MKTVTIKIHLTGNGISVSPPNALADQGDDVQWELTPANGSAIFAVDFCPSNEASTGPGRRSPLPWNRDQKPGNGLAMGQVDEDTPNGPYQYAVAVWDGENLFALDPEIRIGQGRK